MFKTLTRLFQRKKLHVKIAPDAGNITLTEALKGAAGTVHFNDLDGGGVFLWTPNAGQFKAREAVCDLRFASLSPEIAEKFQAATAHLLLPAKACVFQGTDPLKIKAALQYFDYVFIPDRKQKNTWHNLFKTRTLGYAPRKARRLREVLSKKVH